MQQYTRERRDAVFQARLDAYLDRCVHGDYSDSLMLCGDIARNQLYRNVNTQKIPSSANIITTYAWGWFGFLAHNRPNMVCVRRNRFMITTSRRISATLNLDLGGVILS